MKTKTFFETAALLLCAILSAQTQARAEVPVTLATEPPGLILVVDGTNCTAPVNFDWASGSVHTVEAPSPQSAPDGHSRQVFSSWSNGGPQANVITVPLSSTNYTASFSTQYLLEITITPAGAGSVSNFPAGSWYTAGQLVSLTARTNAGYRFSSWDGLDTQTNNPVEFTMSGYRSSAAKFLPANFPFYTVVKNEGAAPGVLIGSIGGRSADGTKLSYVVLDNTGLNPIFSSTTQTLTRFVTPQGLDAVPLSGSFGFKDETFSIVDTFSSSGYSLDTHDVKLLPNGHALLFGTEVRNIDMSQLVPNGRVDASVTGNVIQEIDGNKRVVFEWHTFDHIPITDSFYDLTQKTIDYAHVNSMSIDPTDNNLLASLRTTSEIVKINRRTGEVMWRLGGKGNMFSFIGEHAENAPFYTVGQHDVHRLANGNLLFFDNGNISGGGITPNDRTYSRGVEYQLDEAKMTATLVWEFRHTPDISAPCTGAIKRLANGNTFIEWGCAVPTTGTIATEVSPAGNVVFEMQHRQTGGITSSLLGGGLTKQVWTSSDLVRFTRFQRVVAGQSYESLDAGMSITMNSLDGPPDNAVVVERHLDAARLARFSDKSPQLLMEHVIVGVTNIDSLQAELAFEVPHTAYPFDTPIIHDPAQLIVYHRSTPGLGVFSPLPTMYDPALQKLQVKQAQPGEFVFGYPDVDETPSVPVLVSPANDSDVNQSAPVTLTWSPRGLFASFDVQAATDPEFLQPVLDTNGIGSTSFALQNLLPQTQYFWRVRALTQGGTSEWASASFNTVPPVLRLLSPAGGEVWQRFQVVNIRWTDNLSENVALDIYKGGVSNRNFVASTPSTGSYTWTVGQFQAFPPGSDYTMKIRSTTTPSLYDFSEPFTIINPPVIETNAATRLPDGRVQIKVSVPGATQATVLGSTNLSSWDVLQTITLSAGTAVFTDDTATNFPSRFYRLAVP